MYQSLHVHHQNDCCITIGSDESYFNVSLIVRDRDTQTKTFEGKGEPKQIRTEVPLRTSVTPYGSATPAHSSGILWWYKPEFDVGLGADTGVWGGGAELWVPQTQLIVCHKRPSLTSVVFNTVSIATVVILSIKLIKI